MRNLNVGPDDIKEAMGQEHLVAVSTIADRLSVTSQDIYEVMTTKYDPFLDLVSPGHSLPSAIMKFGPVLQ